VVTVAIIEDDEDFREVLAGMVQAAGHSPILIPTGEKLLETVAATASDVLVTDVLMPEVDGIEVIRAVKSRNPKARIIAISGGTAKMPAPIGLKLSEAFGADRVLFKPFTRTELSSAIDEVLSLEG
jgi:CheY-like chemotaxis protein